MPISTRRVGAMVCWLAAALPLPSQTGLAPVGSYTTATTTANDYATVDGVIVDVRVYRPLGLPPGATTPIVLYSPGGGSGSSGSIGQPGQYEALWQQLASAGATVLYLQNEAESAPGFNFWRLRGDVVLWALAHTAQLAADFGAPIGAQSRAIVAGWSLGAAAVVQHVGADYGFGDYTHPQVRGAILFASPALGAYANTITAAALAQVTRPVCCVFGTDDLGQPGTYQPGDPPATSPRGLGVQAILQGSSPLVVAACLQDANHFEYGAQVPPAGSFAEQSIAWLNGKVVDFTDLVLRGLPDCGLFATGAWADPTWVAWSMQRCLPAQVSFAGSGCATSAGVPTIGTTGGAPVAGNAAFTLTLGDAPPGALFVTAVQVGADLLATGLPVPGAPACALVHLVPDLLVGGVADAAGAANVPLGLLPAGSALWGLRLAAQHAVFDFGFAAFAGAALPFGTSVGLQVVVGS